METASTPGRGARDFPSGQSLPVRLVYLRLMKNLTRSFIVMIGLAGLVAGRDLSAQPAAVPPSMPQPAFSQPVQVPPAMPPPPVAQPSLDAVIKWDAERKELTGPQCMLLCWRMARWQA